MVKHLTPTFLDTPGTTLQLLILLIIRLLNFGLSASETLNKVLLNPEFYLSVTFYILVISSFITSILLAGYVYIKTQDKIAALITQLPWLSFFPLKAFDSPFPVLPAVTNIIGEHLLVVLTGLFNLFFLSLYFSKSTRQELFSVLMLSVVCGFGLATKLTFIPLILIPLMIISWRLKILFILGLISSFILGTFPVICKYPVMFDFIMNYSTHPGLYGKGAVGIIDWPLFWAHLKIIAYYHRFFVFSTLGLFLWSTLQFINNPGNRNTRFIWAATLGSLAHYLFVAKHLAFHYLLIGFSLFSPIFCLFYLGIPKNIVLKRLVVIAIILCCSMNIFQTLMYRKNMSELSNDINNLYEKVSSKYPNSIIVPTNSLATNIYLTPLHGLFLGNYASSHKESGELARLYPNNYFFNTEMTEPSDREDGYGIRDFYGNRVFAEDLLSSGSSVIFIKWGDDFPNYGLTVRLIEKSKYVSAYLLLDSTEKRAYTLFLESVDFLNQKKYQEAFISAFKSKALNFQPENKIDYLLSEIYPQLELNKQ
ncbi:MAG: hypothetical protein HQL14_08420 [Candidatus Omnitrophica bacterium]|nr:hypothetical protein [Candidatus Omnitrophota bacterium]